MIVSFVALMLSSLGIFRVHRTCAGDRRGRDPRRRPHPGARGRYRCSARRCSGPRSRGRSSREGTRFAALGASHRPVSPRRWALASVRSWASSRSVASSATRPPSTSDSALPSDTESIVAPTTSRRASPRAPRDPSPVYVVVTTTDDPLGEASRPPFGEALAAVDGVASVAPRLSPGRRDGLSCHPGCSIGIRRSDEALDDRQGRAARHRPRRRTARHQGATSAARRRSPST